MEEGYRDTEVQDGGGVMRDAARMTPAQVQEMRINTLTRVGGPKDWIEYARKEEETGIPAVEFAPSKERVNLKQVRVPEGGITESAAKVLERLPDADAVVCGTDPIVLKSIDFYERQREMLSRIRNGAPSAALPSAADLNAGNFGSVHAELSRLFKANYGMKDGEAEARALTLLQDVTHRRTFEEDVTLNAAYAAMRRGVPAEDVLSRDGVKGNPYMERMVLRYLNQQQQASLGALALVSRMYGDTWEKLSTDGKRCALRSLRSRFTGLDWLEDVPVTMVDNLGLNSGDTRYENAADLFGAVTFGKALLKAFNPYSGLDPALLGIPELKTNSVHYREAINAMRPAGLGQEIVQGIASAVPFMFMVGAGGFAAGSGQLVKGLPALWNNPLAAGKVAARLFGSNFVHALKTPAYLVNDAVGALGDQIRASAGIPFSVYDPKTGARLEMPDGDADDLYNNFVLAFGRRRLSTAISVGTEGLGEAFDAALKIPVGAKKFFLDRIFGAMSPKMVSRTADMMRQFGVQGFTGEFLEEVAEDVLQPVKDWSLETLGVDVLSTHQQSQLLNDPLRFAASTAGVLAGMRLPFSAAGAARTLADWHSSRLAAEEALNDVRDGDGKPADADRNPVSGMAQAVWGRVRDRLHFVPTVGVEAVKGRYPEAADAVAGIVHEDGTGVMSLSSAEARELVRNHPETHDAVLALLHCATQSKAVEYMMNPDDVRKAVESSSERAQVLTDIANSVRAAVDTIPEAARRRKITGSNMYAFVQLVASTAHLMLGEDYDTLPKEAREQRKAEVIRAVEGLTVASVNADDVSECAEDIRGINMKDALANAEAAQSAATDFSALAGVRLSPRMYHAAEAALRYSETLSAAEDTAEAENRLFAACADALEEGLGGRLHMMRIGGCTVRLVEEKPRKGDDGAEADEPAKWVAVMDSADGEVRFQPGADAEEAAALAARDRRLNGVLSGVLTRDAVRRNTARLRSALNEDIYRTLHDDARLLADGNSIVLRTSAREINLRASTPVYRNLLRAYLLRQSGADAVDVYRQTMWVGSDYGNWSIVLPELHVGAEAARRIADGEKVTLGEIAPPDYAVFGIHPELRDMAVPSADGDGMEGEGLARRAADGDAKAAAQLDALAYAQVADAVEEREQLLDGTIPRVMPSPAGIEGDWLNDLLRNNDEGILNRTNIDLQLSRVFNVPVEHRKNPAEYVLRLARDAGGVDALLDGKLAVPENDTRLKGLTTFVPEDAKGMMNDYSTLIMLFRTADASTVIHETGHWMYRVLRHFAKTPAASRELAGMVDSIDSWLDSYAEGKGAARGTFEWDSVRHEAFAEMFVKYLLTAKADALVEGALSGVRRALMDTYRFLSSNSAIALPDEVTGLFGALMKAEDMFDDGEMPLSALSPDALRMLFTRSGIIDVSRDDLERLASLLDVARDSQTVLAGREALARLDLDAVRADAERAYGSSVWARTREALARLGGIPLRAFMDALPDDLPQERRLALERAVRRWLRDNRLEYRGTVAESVESGEPGDESGAAGELAGERENNAALRARLADEQAGLDRRRARLEELDRLLEGQREELAGIGKELRRGSRKTAGNMGKAAQVPPERKAENVAKLLRKFVSRDETARGLQYVFHDHGSRKAVATDRKRLIVTDFGYIPGKRNEYDGKYPRYQSAFPADDRILAKFGVDPERFLKDVKFAQKHKGYVSFMVDGSPVHFDAGNLLPVAEVMMAAGMGSIGIARTGDGIIMMVHDGSTTMLAVGVNEDYVTLNPGRDSRNEHIVVDGETGKVTSAMENSFTPEDAARLSELEEKAGKEYAESYMYEKEIKALRRKRAYEAEVDARMQDGYAVRPEAQEGAGSPAHDELAKRVEEGKARLAALERERVDGAAERQRLEKDISGTAAELEQSDARLARLEEEGRKGVKGRRARAGLAAMEAADQLARIEKAVGEGEVPAGSLMELAGVLASFRSRPAFVREFVRERKREALGNPDMAVRMKTLDSDRLNAVFGQLSVIFRVLAPAYCNATRRRINAARAMELVGESKVNAVMHNRIDAPERKGEIRLFDGIRAEGKNVMNALVDVVTHFGELRKDGQPTSRALGKVATAQRALESLDRLNRYVAVARRINRAQGMVTDFIRSMRVGVLNRDAGRIDGAALNALKEVQRAVTHGNMAIPESGNESGSWRRRFIAEADAMTAAGEAEPRVWSELCFSDDINVKELTVNELQELSDFCAFIRHTGKTMADDSALGARAHLNEILKNIERIAAERNVDVSALDKSPVAFRTDGDAYAYKKWTLHEAVVATLYLGTASGRQRLRRTIISDPSLYEPDLVKLLPDEALEEIARALPPEILEQVNRIWAAMERVNPEVRDTFRKKNGYALEVLDPVPFEANGVRMTGGYAPVSYRYSAAAYKSVLKRGSGDAKGTEQDMQRSLNASYTPDTQAVHKRKGVLFDHPPLRLSLDVITRYVDEAAHYAAYGMGMPYILRVMTSKEVKNSYERAVGTEAYESVVTTLKQISAPDRYIDKASTVEAMARGAVVARALWGNMRAAAKQFASITVGAKEVGLANIVRELGRFIAAPAERRREVMEASAYMHDRIMHMDEDVRMTVGGIFDSAPKKAYGKVKRLGYALMTLADGVVSGAQYCAAYRKGIEDGMTAAEARAYAEDFVKRTQGSAETMYRPQIKNSFWGRAATMFMTAAIAQYNTVRHDISLYRQEKASLADTAEALAYDLLVPAVICGIVTALTTAPGGDDGDDEWMKRAEAFSNEFVNALYSGIPGYSMALSAWQSMFTDYGISEMERNPMMSAYAAATRSAGNAAQLVAAGHPGLAAMHISRIAGIFSGVPAYDAAARWTEYAKAMHLLDGDADPYWLRNLTRKALEDEK